MRPIPARFAPGRVRIGAPAPTIRLRLTALYGLLFLVTGAVLLTIGYVLVRHNLSGPGRFRGELHKLGFAPPAGFFGHPLGLRPGSPEARFAAAVRGQLLGDALHRLVVDYVIALGVMTMIAVVTGWLLAGRALSPLREITATARRVSGENLGERIALRGPADELQELADTFDGMLERLDSAFASQRNFVANASHELRTPLAIMRTEVDVSLADPDASTEELRAMGEAIREAVDRCERLIAGLLVLARSQAAPGREEPVDLAVIAGDCITDLRAVSLDAGVDVRADLEPAFVNGDPALLERLIANLLDNGIRHNERGGFLLVSTRVRSDQVLLRVANGGTHLSASEAASLTEPFLRLHRSVPGFGLGLSIVSSVARAHGGTAEVRARDAGGLEVLVAIPALASTQNIFVPRSPASLMQS
jgi:signal transduction histidine kinase